MAAFTNPSFLPILAFVLAALAPAAVAAPGGPFEYLGCFSGPTELARQPAQEFMSVGLCQSLCTSGGVAALSNGSDCFCGTAPPPDSLRVGGGKCNARCVGYTQEFCKLPVLPPGWLSVLFSFVVRGGPCSARASARRTTLSYDH